MGIQGLLPLLKSIMLPIHVKDFEGSSVAVDTYSWLHKGALSCSRELCKGLPTSRHIDYCMHRVNLLRHYGVKPVLIFDGGLLPMKCDQENKRARSRKENLGRAIQHESDGNSAAAYECYQKAVDISPLIANQLIQVLKQENVSYIVAPYEADAQMAFLAINKQVDAVITEDSDLIPFGCPRIIFKMDKFGQGVEFNSNTLQKNKDLNLSGFTNQMLLEMCILSGCDYLQSLPGMGLKRAHALIKKFTSYDKVLKHLRYSTVSVPPLFEETFTKAVLTFRHQRVYDPKVQDIVHLSEFLDTVGDDMDFLGPLIEKHIAKGIAEGNIDPITKMPFQEEKKVAVVTLEGSPQVKKFQSGSVKKKLELPVQKNVLTTYFCFASLEAKRNFRAPRMSGNKSCYGDGASCSPKELPGCKLSLSSASIDIATPKFLLEDSGVTQAIQQYESLKHGDDLASLHVQDVGGAEAKEHTSLKQLTHSVHKPCAMLKKERDEYKNDSVLGEEKVRIEKKKVIVRSSYFKPKNESKNDEENNPEKFSSTNETTNPEIFSFKYDSSNCAIRKRKTSPIDIQMLQENAKPRHSSRDSPAPENDHQLQENVKPIRSCRDALPPAIGDFTHVVDGASEESKGEEEKFGSKVSHLADYACIAERSMERFVSAISSIRYSCGSRASGLRAPLKEVGNAPIDRSEACIDFERFSYVPNKGGTTSFRSRRRLS